MQDEDGEVDHKVLATIPGQDIALGEAVVQELQEFIYAIFAQYPDMHIRVGPLLPREAAVHHLKESRPTEAGSANDCRPTRHC